MRDRHRLDEVLLEHRLDSGLDLLDAAHHLLDLGAASRIQQRNARAGASRVAGRMYLGQVAVRDQPEDHCVLHIDVAAERTGKADGVDALQFQPVHQQLHPGIKCCLGKLDGAHVVLGDRDQRFALAHHVRERTARLHHARAAMRIGAIEHAVLVDDACEIQFRDHLDDARTTNAGDAGGGNLVVEARLVRPLVAADHLEARFQRFRVDADALDGTRCRALPARNLCAFERRSRG